MEERQMNRTSERFVSVAAMGVVAVGIAAAGRSYAQPMSQPAAGLKTGEPYVLAGKRMVFTSWYYVRPGSFSWVDDKGQGVTVVGSQGPWEAHFRRGDYPHGIRLVVERAQRVGPIIAFERPWEGKGVQISTLIHDGDKYRGWGGCQTAEGRGFSCYFESKDGWKWERPNLGIVEFNGSKDTNLFEGSPGTVFIDPSAPADERYKAVTTGELTREEVERFCKRRPEAWEHRADRADVGKTFCVAGSVSADGFHWKRLDEPLVVEHCDTQIVAYFDQQLHKYVIYTRNWMVGRRAPDAPDDRGLSWLNVGRRSIGRTESDNFREFPLSQVILEPGPQLLPSDTLYTNCKTTIPGAPDHHLLFPSVWHTSDDTCSVVAASSHDGRIWHYLPGGPVLTTGPFGQWDGGCIFAAPNLVELPDGSFVLPYTGYIFPHKYPRGKWKYQTGYAVWPKGRLIALEAEDRGEFATVTFIPPGRKLRINAVTQRAGSILVEAVGSDGKPLAGRSFDDATPIIGDQHRTTVIWKGGDDLGSPGGQAVMLRFRMEKAKLYGLDFE